MVKIERYSELTQSEAEKLIGKTISDINAGEEYVEFVFIGGMSISVFNGDSVGVTINHSMKCVQDRGCGAYGRVLVPSSVFYQLDETMFISSSTDSIKFMCANSAETQHLISLGVDVDDVCCDWYEIHMASG